MKSVSSSGVYSMCTTRFCDEAAGPLSEPASLEVFFGDIESHNDQQRLRLVFIEHMHRVHQEFHDFIDFFCGRVRDI